VSAVHTRSRLQVSLMQPGWFGSVLCLEQRCSVVGDCAGTNPLFFCKRCWFCMVDPILWMLVAFNSMVQ